MVKCDCMVRKKWQKKLQMQEKWQKEKKLEVQQNRCFDVSFKFKVLEEAKRTWGGGKRVVIVRGNSEHASFKPAIPN